MGKSTVCGICTFILFLVIFLIIVVVIMVWSLADEVRSFFSGISVSDVVAITSSIIRLKDQFLAAVMAYLREESSVEETKAKIRGMINELKDDFKGLKNEANAMLFADGLELKFNKLLDLIERNALDVDDELKRINENIASKINKQFASRIGKFLTDLDEGVLDAARAFRNDINPSPVVSNGTPVVAGAPLVAGNGMANGNGIVNGAGAPTAGSRDYLTKRGGYKKH